MQVAIVGAGVGGLTLGLALQRAGIDCTLYEAAPELRALGLGINLLPHAARVMAELGLLDELSRVGVQTRESAFFNRFGQHIYSEPCGRAAGYQFPQISIHRGDLQVTLLDAFRARAGHDRVVTGHVCTGVEQTAAGAQLHINDPQGRKLPVRHADIVIGADGIRSVIRKQLHPNEKGDAVFSGINMWRGVTRWPRFLSGASMTRVGWLTHAKLVIYPIRDNIDAEGRQLINWVVEIESDLRLDKKDWNRSGRLEDFFHKIQDWNFDWLDVATMVRQADMILEFPMVDRDPLPWWTQGRITLLGDAAHPMLPRGSNGGAQAILDAESLARHLSAGGDPQAALMAYDAERRSATTNVVLTNRRNPPDAILREVFERSGDRPFDSIDSLIGPNELRAIADSYRQVAGVDRGTRV
jgi:5-methylphenazine-1-carboxylate 1-monooxygenase